MKSLSIISLSLFLTFLFSSVSIAEPWISNRYAQNCAACHGPGRWNLPPKKRRCTLSCQGCHVNPNGGGLRNEYGKWNQQRWLKSFSSKKLNGDNRIPAPHKFQPYNKNDMGYYLRQKFLKTAKSKKLKYRKGVRKYLKNEKPPDKESKKKKLTAPKMLVIGGLKYRTRDFDKYSYIDWHIDASDKLFLSRIPEQDPYYKERKKFIFAGGDLRYFYGTVKSETKTDASSTTATRKLDMNALMGVDLSVRYRPIKENFSLVFENRFLNSPNNSKFEQAFSKSQVRSAYALADYLVYNSYAMAGLYRPMFGLHNVDHESIANSITGLDQYAVAKAIGFGAAPNVPFANISFIRPMKDQDLSNNELDNQEGYVLNIGARFVTFSFNTKFSIWSTGDKITTPSQEIRRDMQSLTAGAMFFDRLITNLEVIRAEKSSVTTNGKDGGNVYTLDLKYRLWREQYLAAFFGTSNIARDYAKGSANEVGFGYKAYLLPGMKLELMLINREDKWEANNKVTTTDLLQAQFHYFF